MVDSTPTKRTGQVISVTMTPVPRVEVTVGDDTSVTHFAPFLDSYVPKVDDYVELLENQGSYVVLGSKETSIAFSATGPSSQQDYGTGNNIACTLAVPLIAGRYYMVGGYIIGTQITLTGIPAAKLFAGGADIGPSVRLIGPGFSVGTSIAQEGYAAWRYLAGSTSTVTFTLVTGTTAGAFRVPANSAQITVQDNGT